MKYYPSRWTWERKNPKEVGLDPEKISKAVEYAKNHETKFPVNLMYHIRNNNNNKTWDDGEVLGPTKPRTGPNGFIIKNGYIVAEWGDTSRVDMTFSVSKSYLSTCAGLALDRGLIEDIHDPVYKYVPTGEFDSPHNRKITWHHMLQQTNEWDGSLWDKDYRAAPPEGSARDPEEPGTVFEYNDTRVNAMALALLHVWRKPLPHVLKRNIMDPIEASSTWRWHGYRNSWIELDGVRVQSVSGGGHWGGGMWINSYDQARFGLLWLNKGRWGEEQLLSKEYVEMAIQKGDVNPSYGYMWWMTPERWSSAPNTCYTAAGAGGNFAWCDPEHDIMLITRWLDADELGGLIKHVMSALG
jgi:CubicO group peptidase (beta-lactamase class C family)